MRPPYLTGDRVYLRPMLPGDAEHATAWFESPFPINSTRAAEVLKEVHTRAWGEADPLHLAVVRLAGETIVGGTRVSGHSGRHGRVRIHAAPWLPADEAGVLRAEILGLVVPWLRDELELMTVTVDVAADETASLAAATSLGMVLGVRLREHVLRAEGRVDLIQFQALKPDLRVPEGANA